MKQQMKHIFSILYKKNYRKSISFVKSYVRSEDIAIDITTDAFLLLWEKMIEGMVEKPEALLVSILRNKALDHLRHEAIKVKALDNIKKASLEELNIRISMLEDCKPDQLLSSEINLILGQTLNSVEEQTREIFKLSRFKYKTNKEIASLYGLSVKSIEYHISKMLKILREALKDYLE